MFHKNFIEEDEEYILPYILHDVRSLLKFFIHINYRKRESERIFDTLLNKLKITESESITKAIVAALLTYITSDEQLEQSVNWLRLGEIFLTSESEVYKLNKTNRYSVIKSIFKSSKYTMEEKLEFLNKEASIDFSDVDV